MNKHITNNRLDKKVIRKITKDVIQLEKSNLRHKKYKTNKEMVAEVKSKVENNVRWK